MIAALFENAPNGFFAFDEKGTTVLINETLASILEKTKEEYIGKSVEHLLTLPTRIFFQTHFLPMIKLHNHVEEIFITLLGSKGKHLPVLMNAKNMEWEGAMITCCSCIHVPNRKKFEDELVAARKTAETALRENSELLKAKAELELRTEQLDRQMQIALAQNGELQQFGFVVTHSIKEPVRKILMYSDKLSKETTTPLLSKLIKATEQMNAIVSGLQQYVWLNEKSGQYVPVDLNDLIKSIDEQIKQEVYPVSFFLQCNQLPVIEGDQKQLKLLFHHLLVNAVKFRKGASAQVTIEGVVMKQNRFRAVEDKYTYRDVLRLEITDEGIGFDPEYANQVFDLFRKLHYNGGLGLGLALCKKVVDNHQGHIEADSRVNEFTRITVWLPLSQ